MNQRPFVGTITEIVETLRDRLCPVFYSLYCCSLFGFNNLINHTILLKIITVDKTIAHESVNQLAHSIRLTKYIVNASSGVLIIFIFPDFKLQSVRRDANGV